MANVDMDVSSFRKSLLLDALVNVWLRGVLRLSASFRSLSISSSMLAFSVGVLAILLPQIPHTISASWQMVPQR